MENETAIKKSIEEFVFTKIQEQVYLDISQSNTIISVKHRSKHGSTALANLWVCVLKHQNNYPKAKYPYKELCDKNGNNKVILKVDSVTLTVFMSTGTLMIQGHSVLKWFGNQFPNIMLAYDAPIRDTKAVEDREIRQREDHADSLCMAEGLQETEDSVASQLADELKLMSLNVWSGDTLQEQLDNLRTCCIRDGPTFIYKLWKSVLHHWFSDPNRKVYIVTPFLDAPRLVDICNIILEHRLKANLDALYVRKNCDHNGDIFEVKQNAFEKYDVNDQPFIEHKIFANIIFPLKRFHAKFIGCIRGNEAEVLVTSANFHSDHFKYSNLESVQYQNMSDVEFISRFLEPINASVLEKK